MNAPAFFGHDPQPLDRLAADIHERVMLVERRHRYAHDFMAIKSSCRKNGRWVAEQIDAGMFGDGYAGLSLPDAMNVALQCWREAREEMRGE